MPKVQMNVKRTQVGVIFDAAATKAAAFRAVTEVNEALAQEGVTRVKARLQMVLRNPTGRYESNIQVDRGTRMRGFSDNRIAYGGWLEGVDPRNAGRFKGYGTFRKVRQEIENDKAMIAQPVIDRLVRELNG